MTTLTTISEFQSAPAAGTSGIIAMFRAWQVRRSHRRVLLALMEADDYRLRDIGVTRGDVAALIRGRSSL